MYRLLSTLRFVTGKSATQIRSALTSSMPLNVPQCHNVNGGIDVRAIAQGDDRLTEYTSSIPPLHRPDQHNRPRVGLHVLPSPQWSW